MMTDAEEKGLIYEPTPVPAGFVHVGGLRYVASDGEGVWAEVRLRRVHPDAEDDGDGIEVGSVRGYHHVVESTRVAELHLHVAPTWTLDVKAKGIPVDALREIALTIPIVGDRGAFEPPADQPIEPPMAGDVLLGLLGGDASRVKVSEEVGEDGTWRGASIRMQSAADPGFRFLGVGLADLNPLVEVALEVRSPRLVADSGIPMVLGVVSDTIADALWVQRGWFWHLFAFADQRALQTLADEISGRLLRVE